MVNLPKQPRKPKAPKPAPVFKDILGRVINEGMYVAFPRGTDLLIGMVHKCHQKQMRVIPITKTWRSTDGFLVYPSATIIVDGPHATMYVLKHGAK